MKKIFTTKIIPILMAVVCLFCTVLPVFAADKGKTEVLFVCDLDKAIETDQYSIIVVELLNEDTMKTTTYKLYQYNSFSERYILDNGTYSIIYAYIQGRNDIIFDLEAKDSFSIGFENTIYFKLIDSKLMEHEEKSKTTQPNTITTTTKKTEPSTLFPIYTTENNSTTDSDITNVTNNTEITETTNINESTHGDDVTGTTHISDETTTQQQDTSNVSGSTTQESTTAKQSSTFQKKMSMAFIIVAIIILLLIMAFAIFYTKKKE